MTKERMEIVALLLTAFAVGFLFVFLGGFVLAGDWATQTITGVMAVALSFMGKILREVAKDVE